MTIDYAAVGGRRYVLVVAICVLTAVLLWFGRLSGTDYVTVVIATAAAYVTGNVYQKKVEAKAEAQAGESQPPTE